jgi:hypothetical protein
MKSNVRSYVGSHCNKWPFKCSRTSASVWVEHFLDEAHSSLIARTTNMPSSSVSWGGRYTFYHHPILIKMRFSLPHLCKSSPSGLSSVPFCEAILLRRYAVRNLEMPRSVVYVRGEAPSLARAMNCLRTLDPPLTNELPSPNVRALKAIVRLGAC